MAVTIKDIAKLAGVSVSTVSKILNGKDHDISVPTKERVKRIIEEKKYSPNRIAQSMVTKHTKTIGLIIPDVRNPFFTEMARGVEDMAVEHGYSVIFCNTDDDLQKEIRYIEMLNDKQVDGLVLAPAVQRSADMEREVKCSVPIVVVDRDASYSGIRGRIRIDNFQGAYDAVSYLIGMGHRDILLLSGPLHVQTSVDRMNGYKKALEEHNIVFHDELVAIGDYKGQWAGEQIARCLERGQRFTALFCGNDLIAIEAVQSLRRSGMAIPEQVSVAGFDDIPFSTVIYPALTTVKQPSYDIGVQSIRTLLRAFDAANRDSVEEVTLMPAMQVRESTGPVLTK